MRKNLFDHSNIALTATDDDGPTVITWARDWDGSFNPDAQCDGWINGGYLFAPADGDKKPGTFITGGIPDEDANWYNVASGIPAVMLNGIPHASPFDSDHGEDLGEDDATRSYR